MEDTVQNLIAEMLANGEIGTGPTTQAHAVVPIVEHVMNMLRPSIAKQVNLSLQADRAQPGAAVYMEPIEIQQILIQLLRNACDAQLKPPGTVVIAVEECTGSGLACLGCARLICGDYVRLQVSDEGGGMDAATMAHIFEPFFTTHAEHRRAGLGLAIVNALTHQAGGHVHVVSAIQLGTSIEIWLPSGPVAAQRTASSQPSDSPLSRNDANQPRVWLVNEDLATALYLTAMLRDAGMAAESFTDAGLCLRAFQMQPDGVDAVIVDHDGAALTGPALIRTMLSIRPDVIGIVCVNADQQDHEYNARQAGARVVIRKPFDSEHLLQAIRRHQPR